MYERERERKRERHRECVWHVYLLHFSPKPLLTVLNWNTELLVFVFHSTNSCFSTVMSWLEVVISFNICVCVMCTLGQQFILYIENILYDRYASAAVFFPIVSYTHDLQSRNQTLPSIVLHTCTYCFKYQNWSRLKRMLLEK